MVILAPKIPMETIGKSTKSEYRIFSALLDFEYNANPAEWTPNRVNRPKNLPKKVGSIVKFGM